MSRKTRASQAGARDRPTHGSRGGRPFQLRRHLRKPGKEIGKTHTRLGGEQTDAHLLGTDGRDIRLPLLVPVDLSKLRPGCYPIVALKAETRADDGELVEPGPPAHGRMQPIGSDEPAVRHPEPLALDPRGRDRPHRGGPVDRHPDLVGTLDEGLMEPGTADTQADPRGKASLHTLGAVHEPKAEPRGCPAQA